MERISKPNLVDLLRTFDRFRWLQPRIRYASVRSKPMLIRDLREVFRDELETDRITFVPRRPNLQVPRIEYLLKARHFLIGGVKYDLPKHSRRPIRFQIERGPITLHFPMTKRSPGPPSTQTTVVAC